MRRIVVLGGLGFFGAAAVDRLRAGGATPLVASRRADGDLQVNVEDGASLRAALRPGDVVIDAAGPFQDRTTTLVESAIEIGFDVVDISDSVDYALKLYALQPRIDAAALRVLTSCSSLSAVTAALVRASGVRDPVRVSIFLAPATRYTATRGTSGSLWHSVGRPIRVWRDGRLITTTGWRESRSLRMPPPVGAVRGHLMESVDAVTLPRIWPGLRQVEFWVDARARVLEALFHLAARVPALRGLVKRVQPYGLPLARRLGSSSGGMAVEIEDGRGATVRCTLVSRERSYLTAIAPAILAARAIAEGRFADRGLVPHDRHVDPHELIEYLRGVGVECHGGAASGLSSEG